MKPKPQASEAAPPPDLLSLIPIRKTRAGLQFTCAAPTIGLNSKGLKDVWVCNSDGYVGQVCVLSLRPEPTVICCNGVCNARILSIVSVPSLPSPCQAGEEREEGRQGLGWGTPPGGWVTPDTPSDWGGGSLSSKPWLCSSDGGTADSSPQSGHTGPLHLEDESSEDEEVEGKPRFPPPPLSNLEPEGAVQATMWLGTEDGTIHVYNCTDNIRIKKNKDKFCHPAPVLAILYLNNRVFAALATGQIFIYSRDLGGVWDKTGYETVRLGSAERPVTKMLIVGDTLWCATGHQIKVLNPVTKELEDTIAVGSDESKFVTGVTEAGLGVWVAQAGSASVFLIHAGSRQVLGEVSSILTSSASYSWSP